MLTERGTQENTKKCMDQGAHAVHTAQTAAISGRRVGVWGGVLHGRKPRNRVFTVHTTDDTYYDTTLYGAH